MMQSDSLSSVKMSYVHSGIISYYRSEKHYFPFSLDSYSINFHV